MRGGFAPKPVRKKPEDDHGPVRSRLADLTASQQIALRSLVVDRVTAEVVVAMTQEGVRPILLKGPSFARWLYPPGAPRGYVDSDLLVSPDDRHAAELVLERLGFVQRYDDVDTPGWRQHACEWRRGSDGASVDLHRSLLGVEADDGELWDVIAEEDTAPITVGGVAVEALSPAARTLHVALHAAHHGARHTRSLADLDRALATIDESLWRDAAALAARIRATSAFVTGLRLHPAGQTVVKALDLPTARSAVVALLASTPPPGALAWEVLAETPGWAPRAHFVIRKVVPTRRFLRYWSPLASRGRLGLLAAYCWRPLWLLGHAWPGFLAWRRVRRRG